MSFRTRLTGFFVVIVVLPMAALGLLTFRLIDDSEQGKAAARADGLATGAASLYQSESALARGDARAVARGLHTFKPRTFRARLSALTAGSGLARVTATDGSRTLADVGDPSAVAPGTAVIKFGSSPSPIALRVSELTAAQYARDLAAPGVAVVVREGGRTLSSTLATNPRPLPREGTVTLRGVEYRSVAQDFPGFGRSAVTVTILSDLAATSASLTGSRLVAAAFLGGFLLLALSFSVLVSRALQGQLARFLDAARRLASGDFSSPVPVEGNDEFAALGAEFNNMSNQLEHRLDELADERARLREAIRRIGQTFAANLDRAALLQLALETAADAVQASSGRLSIGSASNNRLVEMFRKGYLAGAETGVDAAERAALRTGRLGESTMGNLSVASIPVGLAEGGRPAHGLITVARRDRPFTASDREVLDSLAAQAALALENVELHFQVQRQAVTDELTGLSNHGRFQELLNAEVEQVRRYHHATGLIMLDIDDFKAINDTHGHQQGDVVLRHIGRVLRDNSRDADSPARYGGEEMALILPHTDLEGAFTIAERIRTAIEGLRIPRVDRRGILRVTASLGVVAATEGTKDALIKAADAALYEAKRRGKNRTVRAPTPAANVVEAE